jgi:L-ascorbate metabolism protein UlaG (beta-lactamase superfamily)
MLDKLVWLGHASFRIDGSKRIYIDPWKISGGPQADLVLVSHSHYDHYSQEDIDRISGPDTVLVTVEEVAAKAKGNVEVVEPGDTVEVKGVKIEAPPAYNIGKQFHPKSNGWVGFVVELDGKRLYYAGDTDDIPEMRDLLKIDVALLPVGGTYTMNAAEAAEAAKTIKPGVAVPYHWGDIVGDAADARRFAQLYGGKVEILKPAV